MINKPTQEFITQHIKDNIRDLALKKQSPDIDLQFALTQIAAHQILSKKVPTWTNFNGIIFPKHLSLEQASSEYTAKFKAKIVKKVLFPNNQNFIIADLTGGLGIDCYFMSQNADEIHYIEMNKELVDIAKNNFAILNREINIHNLSAEEFLKTYNKKFHLIYIDPARRDESGKKLVSITDCSPNIVELESYLWQHTDIVMIKLSPMLDISLALKEMNNVFEIYIISQNNECKELLFVLKKSFIDEPTISAININNKGNYSQIISATQKEENNTIATIATEIKDYLYEPYVSILKAGFYKTITRKCCVEKLDINSHLYTSSTLLHEFPGRKFKVQSIKNFDKDTIKNLNKEIKKANITTRNFPLSVDTLRKRLKIKDGGNIFIFATTFSNNKILIICEACIIENK